MNLLLYLLVTVTSSFLFLELEEKKEDNNDRVVAWHIKATMVTGTFRHVWLVTAVLTRSKQRHFGWPLMLPCDCHLP